MSEFISLKPIVTMDYDGTMTKESSLLTSVGTIVMENSSTLGPLLAGLYLQRSRLRDDALKVVRGFSEMGLEIDLLTSRFPSLRRFTLQSLEKLGFESYFTEIFFNPNPKLKGWKREKVGQLVLDGHAVFHFDDREDEAEEVASLGPGTYVYWVNNAFYPRSLPENVIQVPTLTAGFRDLIDKLSAHKKYGIGDRSPRAGFVASVPQSCGAPLV